MDSKPCKQCGETKPLDDYYRQRGSRDGHRSLCKPCYNAKQRVYDARRCPEKARARFASWYAENRLYVQGRVKARRLQERIPAWQDIGELVEVYENRPEGMEVDHIVPLNGKGVCGLHVPWNLAYLTPEENRAKGNSL